MRLAGGCCWEWWALGRWVPEGCSCGGTRTGWQQNEQLPSQAKSSGRAGCGGDGRAEPVLAAREHRFAEPSQMCLASPPATLPTSAHIAPARLVPEAMATPTSLLYLPSRCCWKYSCSAGLFWAQLNHPGSCWARLAL